MIAADGRNRGSDRSLVVHFGLETLDSVSHHKPERDLEERGWGGGRGGWITLPRLRITAEDALWTACIGDPSMHVWGCKIAIIPRSHCSIWLLALSAVKVDDQLWSSTILR